MKVVKNIGINYKIIWGIFWCCLIVRVFGYGKVG